MSEGEELLDERGNTYGRAWYIEGLILDRLNEYHTNHRELNMWFSVYQGQWRAIMAKMARLLESPGHVDSWADIEGYARLAHRHIVDGVWHGEEERKKAEFTTQCAQTYSARGTGTLPAWDSNEGEIEIPYTHYRGTIESDGDGGLVIKDMVEVEEGYDFRVAKADRGARQVLGMVTEDCRAGDIVAIAQKVEVQNG